MGSDRNLAKPQVHTAARSGAPEEPAPEGYWGRIPIRGRASELAKEVLPILALTPITRCWNTSPRSAVASNCIAVVDRYISVFILAPLSPPALWLLGSDTNLAKPQVHAAAHCAAPCGR